MVTFQVLDMTCGRCAQTLEAAVSSIHGSGEVVIDIVRKLVQVKGKAATAALADAIRRACYTPVEVTGALATRPAPVRRGCCGGRMGTAVDMGQATRPSSGPCCN